ncbi:hypothetical protein SO802_008875 [Lithocarpus litseifolius]|uniref:Uncharacterized protein n=1 Tax=Lithocarpus litseifolius TaxID=425828 RepID=A0AAW2DCN0_9ROSI
MLLDHKPNIKPEVYDALDPTGNITIKWDVISLTPDGYVATVKTYNFKQYCHIQAPGWMLGWTWANKEVIWSMMGGQTTEAFISFKCRIKRIPDHLRKVNEQAYTPTIISVGPFNNYNKNLRTMEKFKVRYFKSFVKWANINSENLVSTTREMEVRISYCYAEASLGMDRDVVWKRILVDAIFILELIIRNDNERKESDDFLIMDQMDFIIFDLVLLENQLPFFVPEKLFNFYPNCSHSSSLIDQNF